MEGYHFIEERGFQFPKSSAEKRLVVGAKNKVFFDKKEDTSMCSKITAFTEQDSSSDESLPDLSSLNNVVVPIPVKSSRGPFQGFPNSPSFLAQCTKATRESRFLSFVDQPSAASPQLEASRTSSISGEPPLPSVIDFNKLAQLTELGSFSMISSRGSVSSDQSKPLLNDLVERFLQNLKISEQEVETLSQGERMVLDCLIKRKLKIGLEEYVMSYQSIDYGLLKVKRLEENYKMVFKSALKHLGNLFKKKRKGKKAVKNDDNGFYEYYFSSVARELGVPLEAFYHPNK